MGEIRDHVERQLRRIRERDPDLRSVITLLGDRARRLADELDTAPEPKGPLHGLTAGVKDNIDLAGAVTTAGSAHPGAIPATEHATVVLLLERAGAVVLAKNNMAEFAMGVTGRNTAFGDCRNARDPARIPGGSSSGSAVAVAAGLTDISLGTDTGGSGRIPAAVNGVVGIRPTHGRVSNHGVLPVSPTFDTVTPIAPDVRTAARVLAALDRDESGAPWPAAVPVDAHLDTGLSGMRVGFATGHFTAGVDPGVAYVIETALDRICAAGAEIRPMTVPGAEQAQERMLEIMYPEAAAVHAERIAHAPETIDPDVMRRLRIGMSVPPETTENAHRLRREFRRRVDELFESVDVIVTPTIPTDVPRRDAVDLATSTRDVARFTYAWSLYGGPALSLPCGTHPESGMPVGMQLVAAPWREHVLLRAARGAEDALSPA